MSQTEATQYWIDSALEDWKVAENLFRDKTYNYALFLMQLALEKLIKAIQIKKTDESPLYIHNLVLLSQKAQIELNEEELSQLKEISSFNITARYDNYKRDFYNKATETYATEWMQIGQKIKSKLLTELGIK